MNILNAYLVSYSEHNHETEITSTELITVIHAVNEDNALMIAHEPETISDIHILGKLPKPYDTAIELLAACRMAKEELVFGGDWATAQAIIDEAITNATK